MTKSDLVERLSEKLENITKKDCEVIVDSLLEKMTEALRRGGKIEIRGFGSFTIRIRKAKQGRNPKTGELVSIPEKRVPFFKAGKELREIINK